jgi:endoglucanase
MRKPGFCIICSVFAALLSSTSIQVLSARQEEVTSSIALPLHTEGRWIVDANGNRVKLRSVNWYGAEEQDFVPAGLEIETIQNIAHLIKTMGFNSVRLPWSNQMYESNPKITDQRVLAANPNLIGKHALDIFDDVVHALANEGLLIILDNHMSNADWCCSNNDGNALWYNQDYPESSWIADWKGMAARYANIPEVIGADLRNEPRADATWGGPEPTDWRAAAQRGGNAVLKVNPKLLIFVEGINYALDLTGVANLPVVLNVPHRWSIPHTIIRSLKPIQMRASSLRYGITIGATFSLPASRIPRRFGSANSATAIILPHV